MPPGRRGVVVVLEGDRVPEVRGNVAPRHADEAAEGQSFSMNSSAMSVVSSRILNTFSLGVIN